MSTRIVLAEGLGPFSTIVILVYLLLVGYLGYLGWRRTKTTADYMVGGRKVHPFIMALSYGATFISTSAIVGFGGVAGMFGMSLLWLTFLNIFVGIFIAFVVLAGPTRRMGHHLDAHTFPELLGRRYKSKFIQVFAGLLIFLFIPMYAAAVLIGGGEFISTYFGMPYDTALLVLSVIVAAYVIMGGLKGVMYTDALQGTIMFVGMMVLLIWTYTRLGGVENAHRELTDMATVPTLFGKIGFNGWTKMPTFGFGEEKFGLWWIIISTIVMGVGIGVLAQPQLTVRFMTVKSKRELNRAVLVGGIFILVMTGVAFTVGSLSNLFFYKYEKLTGKIVQTTERAEITAKKERGMEVKIPCEIWHIDTTGSGIADTFIVAKGYDVLGPDGAVKAPFSKLMPQAQKTELPDGRWEIQSKATSFTRAVVPAGEGWMFNTDSIIPTFITNALPRWFGILFMLTLLAAAMSTLSSQFHAVGTSIGRDVYEQLFPGKGSSISITRIGIIIGIVAAVLYSHYTRGGYIVATFTAIFFGLCASAFLPAFIGGLYCKWVTPAGAKCSMIIGFLATAFWLVFVFDKTARALGICNSLFGQEGAPRYSLLLDKPNWPVVDPMFVALPISLVVLIAVSMITQPPDDDHLAKCFKK